MGMNDICDYCKDKVRLCPFQTQFLGVEVINFRRVPIFSAGSVLRGQLHSLHNRLFGNADERGKAGEDWDIFNVNVSGVVTAASCLCFRSLVWLSTLSRSCPCRLWGRCRSPPRAVCSRGERLSLDRDVNNLLLFMIAQAHCVSLQNMVYIFLKRMHSLFFVRFLVYNVIASQNIHLRDVVLWIFLLALFKGSILCKIHFTNSF